VTVLLYLEYFEIGTLLGSDSLFSFVGISYDVLVLPNLPPNLVGF